MKKKSTKKVDEYMLSVSEIKRHMSALSEEYQYRIDTVIEQFSGINKKLDVHADIIVGLREDMEIMKMNTEIIKSGLQMKVDYKDFMTLEKRVRLVEHKLHR